MSSTSLIGSTSCSNLPYSVGDIILREPPVVVGPLARYYPFTMRAELKELHSPDVDFDNYWPDDIRNFSFFIQAMIGPEGEEIKESFGFLVCTPKWLIENKKTEGAVFGKHLLIIFEYDLQLVESQIAVLCSRTIGEDWNEIAQKLRYFGQWEFENYRPSGR